MKRILALVAVIAMLIMATACSKKQTQIETPNLTTHVASTPADDMSEGNTPLQTEEPKTTESISKETLAIRPAETEDGDPNNEELIISDKDGNEAQMQIGVGTGEGTGDAPDTTEVPASNNISIPSIEATESTTPPAVPPQTGGHVGPDLTTTYLEYEAMSGTEQTIFYYSFADADAFLEWFNAAKQAYEEGREDIYIGEDGTPEN